MGDLKKHDRGEAHKLIKAIKEITDQKCDCELSAYGDGEEPRTFIMCSTGGLSVDPDTAEKAEQLREKEAKFMAILHDPAFFEGSPDAVRSYRIFQKLVLAALDDFNTEPTWVHRARDAERKLDAAEKYIAEKKENLEREINDGTYSDQLALLLHLEKAMKEA